MSRSKKDRVHVCRDMHGGLHLSGVPDSASCFFHYQGKHNKDASSELVSEFLWVGNNSWYPCGRTNFTMACAKCRKWPKSENPTSGWNRLNGQRIGANYGSAGAGSEHIGQDLHRNNPFSSHLITRLCFVMCSSCHLQMHKVPFGAGLSVSFSTLRQCLAPPTCLKNTRSVV